MSIPAISPDPSPSAYERLTNTASALLELTPSDDQALVSQVFRDYVRLYKVVMKEAADAHPYRAGLVALEHYDPGEAALTSGKTTLENLQHVVSQSLDLLP